MPTSKIILDFKSEPYRFLDKHQAEAFASHLGLPKNSAESFFKTATQIKAILPFDATSDYTPKEDDFIRVSFRLLSCTVVGGGSWKCTDFSNEAVLMKSIPRLIGKIAYTNHEQCVGNEVGVIESAKWTSAAVGPNGEIIPPGIDGVYKINARKNPALAMALLSTPPEIQSSSVTVDFEWEPSHTFNNPDGTENTNWFNWMIGDIGSDGKMIRRVVTQVLDYYESSLVWMGADPFAKILGADGQPINIDRTSVVTALIKESKQEDAGAMVALQNAKYYLQLDFSKDEAQVQKAIIENISDMSLKSALAIALNIPESNLTEESISQFIAGKTKEVSDLEAEITIVKSSNVSLTKEKEDLLKTKETHQAEKALLETELSKTKELSEFGSKVIDSKKAEAIRLYKVASKDKADDAIISLIQKSDQITLEAMLRQYGSSCMEQFGGSCKSCGSQNLSFRSSVMEDPGEIVSQSVSLSVDQLREKYDTGKISRKK